MTSRNAVTTIRWQLNINWFLKPKIANILIINWIFFSIFHWWSVWKWWLQSSEPRMAQGQAETKNCLLLRHEDLLLVFLRLGSSNTLRPRLWQTVLCIFHFTNHEWSIKQENKNKDYVICGTIVYNNYELELTRFLDSFNIFKLNYLHGIMSGRCDLYWPCYKLL